MQFSVTLLLSFYLNFPFDFFRFKNDKATLFMSAIHRALMQRVLLSSSANLVKNISDFFSTYLYVQRFQADFTSLKIWKALAATCIRSYSAH